MKKASELYKLDKLKEGVESEIMRYSPEDLEFEEGRYELFVDEIASGAAGIYQANEAAEFFGLDLDEELEEADIPEDERAGIEDWTDYEFAWEAIDEAAQAIADELNEATDLPGTFYYGHTEGGSDYGLMYSWDKGDHPEFDDEDDEEPLPPSLQRESEKWDYPQD